MRKYRSFPLEKKFRFHAELIACVPSSLMTALGQSLQIDDIRAMSASPPTAVELMRRREQ